MNFFVKFYVFNLDFALALTYEECKIFDIFASEFMKKMFLFYGNSRIK
jgi:hypothetical protein